VNTKIFEGGQWVEGHPMLGKMVRTYNGGGFVEQIHTKVQASEAVIRKVTKGAFRRRLTTAEKVAIKVSNDPIVKVMEDDLLVTSFVDLDSLQMIEGLGYLESQNILVAGRAGELLADGQQDEAV